MNRRPHGSPRKATLFCGTCDHRSAVDGDWIRRRGLGEVLVCPECGAVVVDQPDVRLVA